MNQRKIFSISMVKNEADVIESFVRYNLNILDGMVILDHFSTDNTVVILKNLINEGLPITLWPAVDVEHNQNKMMTALMYKTFKKFQPDIIIPLDADEFIVSADGTTHPRKLLEELADGNIYKIHWKTYFPHEKDNPDYLLITQKIQHCIDGFDHTQEMSKAIVFRSIAKKYKPSLSMGSHNLNINWRFRAFTPRIKLQSLRLAHFPIRSIDQLKSKIFVNQINNLSRIDSKKGESFHIKDLFEKMKSDDRQISISDLQRFVADSYFPGKNLTTIKLKHSPVRLSFCTALDMRYTKLNETNYLKNVLENCTILAKHYADLKREKYSLTKTAMSILSVINGLTKQLITRRILGFNRDVDKYQL